MDWPESGPYQRDILLGAHRQAERRGVNLLVLPGSVLRGEGAFPAWSLGWDEGRPLDGLIVATATIVGAEGSGWLVDRLGQRDVPVVSIGEMLPGSPSVLVENGEAFSQLLDHLLADHGYRNPVLVTGLLTLFDARERLRVFQEALARHGIVDDGNRVVAGDFQFTGGREAVRTLWSRPGPRPDVVVCSNDNMAFGALHELSLRSIRVPADVALTGFDDIEFSPFFESPVTTIRQPLSELAARAVDQVLDRIAGTPSEGATLPTVPVIRGSCGCPYPGPVDAVGRHLANQLWQYEQTDASLVLDGLLSQLSAAYQEGGPLSELVPLESRVLKALGLDWWYWCTADPDAATLVPHRLHVATPQGALFDGPPLRFPGPLDLHRRWTALQVDLTVGPRSQRQFGALIVEYHGRSQGRFEFLRARLSEAVEAMVATQHLKGLNRALEEAGRRLEELSITDEMTGCPNRRGFLTLGPREIASCRRLGAGFWVLYLDLDGLKAINDRWGHEAGDEAIVGFARVLKGSIRATDLMARLGGDEFLLLAPHAVDSAEAALRQRIGQQLEAYHRRSPAPWRLSCSLGGVYSPPGDTRDLGELMALADARLYEEKQKKKKVARHG